MFRFHVKSNRRRPDSTWNRNMVDSLIRIPRGIDTFELTRNSRGIDPEFNGTYMVGTPDSRGNRDMVDSLKYD